MAKEALNTTTHTKEELKRDKSSGTFKSGKFGSAKFGSKGNTPVKEALPTNSFSK